MPDTIEGPMKYENKSRFEVLLQIRMPKALADAIGAAAGQRFQSKSDYIRSAVVDRLKDDGVDIRPTGGGS